MSQNVNQSLNTLSHPPLVKEHFTAREVRLMRAAYFQGRDDEAELQARTAKAGPLGEYGKVTKQQNFETNLAQALLIGLDL